MIRVPDGEKLEALSSHHDTVSSFSFSDDGALLATASNDRSIRLLQRRGASFEPSFVLRGGLAPMERVRLTPDGRRLLALRKRETELRTWHLDALRQRLEGMHLGW